MGRPTPLADPALLDRLREDLTAAAYTVEGVHELVGPVAAAALEREQALPARRAVSGSGSAAGILVRLFALGDPVDAEEVARALPCLGVDGARALGLVEDEGDALVARCDLRPYAAGERCWWVASDLSELATRRPLAPDHVLGVGAASTTLASWTPRPEVDRALDLGTGCGVQALHLLDHAQHVVVTDLSDRALELARFNAQLNDCSWEARRGSLLDPVAGERFGLIVSNPPFVITPRSGSVPVFEYRDGGAAGDALVADLVRGLAEHLQPGGIAQLLGNWEVPAGGDWRERVGSWLDGTGLDAWVVQRDVQDPAQYAETWARDGGHHPGTAEFAGMYAAWLDDFAARGVASIGVGIITLQRPATDREPYRDLVEQAGPVQQPMGPSVLRGLRARTWLAEHDDADLLSLAWRVADDVIEERHSRPGADDPLVIQLRQGGGLGRVVRLGTAAAAYVSVADGELPAAVLLDAIADLLEQDPAQVRAEVLPVLRDLVADGLLV